MIELSDTSWLISKQPIEILQQDKHFYQCLLDLVSPSYVDPTAMLIRDIGQCDYIYLAYNKSNKLCAFFMVGRDKITIQNKKQDIFYLGLGASSPEMKGSGLIRLLYKAFIQDVQKLEQTTHQRIPLWHTTATPSVFHAFNLMFSDNEPDNNGKYTQEGKLLVSAIRNKKGWPTLEGIHPFVAKGVAHNTLYSDEELARIQRICREKQFDLFERLDIDERKGDRLIRISYAPKIG